MTSISLQIQRWTHEDKLTFLGNVYETGSVWNRYEIGTEPSGTEPNWSRTNAVEAP